MASNSKPMEIITPVIKAIIIGVLVFLSVLSVTIFIAYQQYKFQENKNHEELLRELHHIKDRFRNILYADITTANSMAILFKEYGTPKNFDHIAAQLLQNNKYAEAIQLTVDGVITNVYPRKGFEKTIGINTERDTLRKHEASRAKEKNEIYFAGPRPLRMGGHWYFRQSTHYPKSRPESHLRGFNQTGNYKSRFAPE